MIFLKGYIANFIVWTLNYRYKILAGLVKELL